MCHQANCLYIIHELLILSETSNPQKKWSKLGLEGDENGSYVKSYTISGRSTGVRAVILLSSAEPFKKQSGFAT